MITYDKNNIRLLPLYYNLLMRSESKTFGYQGIETQVMLDIIEEMEKCIQAGKVLVIDMQFISVFGSKTNGSEGPFECLGNLKDKYPFALFNFQKSPATLELVLSDMNITKDKVIYYNISNNKILNQVDDKANWGAMIVSNDFALAQLRAFDMAIGIWNIYAGEIAEILRSKCVDQKIQYLPSSDVYSDVYIRVKDLFLYPQYLSLSIYLLCKLIRDNFSHTTIDAIVSMSNTGSVIANLVGKMLDKDVLFCTNVGPQFALDINNVRKKIMRGANYLYVFDFICLGTEIKNLKSILICHDANTIGGVGIASLPSMEYLRNCDDDFQEYMSVLKNAYSIVPLSEHSISYNISISKKNLGD